MRKEHIYYYSKSQDDEFVTPPKNINHIRGDFKYVQKGFFARFVSFLLYRIIATPIAFIFTHVIKRIRIVNYQVLKPFRNQGIVVYANHTQEIADALTPSIILYPKRSYAIVNAANISLPVLGNITKHLGALPLPEDIPSTRNFLAAVEMRLQQKHAILVYPEAHIWPYYTKIRDYDDTSFVYPVKYDAPVFTFTTTYQTKKNGHLAIVIYVDGPFLAPAELDKKSKQAYLHAQASNTMRERATNSTYEQNKYLPKENL